MYIAFISLILTAVLIILSFAFKIAGKLRLGIPLVYFLLVSTVLNKWAAAHEPLALGILFALIIICVISWLFSLKNFIQEKRYYKAMKDDMSWQIERARNKGVPLDSVYFDSHGNMRYQDTHEIVE